MSGIDEIKKMLMEGDNEGTAEPYWLILDPHQNMRCNVYEMAGGITGPFFSREEAEEELASRRYDYSDKACVYCLSGCHSGVYQKFCRELAK